jgi:hypothetical protein
VLAEGNGVSGDRQSEGSRKQSAGATNRKRILGIPRKGQITSRQNEIGRRTFVPLFGNVIAHRFQHNIL